MKTHPSERELALYAGGDLPWLRRLAVAWHVGRCPHCRREVERFCQCRDAMRAASALPPELDWPTLLAEMKANIRLGLAAGELIRRRAEPGGFQPADWRVALIVSAAMAVVAVAGWTLQRRTAPAAFMPAAGVVLHQTEDGLWVRWGRNEAAVFGAGQPPVAAAVSWDGGARARFVDEETGQVTIYDVAAQ
ncbi:MAG: hypothetical protein ACUVS7_09895 [Bryobacteraceae bacterium]